MGNNKIREFREKAGISQVELARRSKMASTNLSAIERGTLKAWPKVKKAISRALKMAEGEIWPANAEVLKNDSDR